MIAALIRASIRNRFLVLMAAALLAAWGVWSMLRMPLDALPELSDTQVIVRTSWPGQPPQVVEDQLTYPLATTMLSVPGVKTVRAYSFFGDSFVYVIFHGGTDLYWARSRVLEYLSQARSRLPAGVDPALGPDATGLGWIYQYALVDERGTRDLGQLRALQDWFLRYQLKTVPDVAEVASIGGMVRAWQIVVDPIKLAAYRLTLQQVADAVRAANGATGGSVIAQGEADLMVRSTGYLRSRADFERIPLRGGADGALVRLRDVAVVRRGPTFRQGIAELDGRGEVVGGVVILRSGKNALRAIDAVKQRLAVLQRSLPAGVRIVPTYDRSQLIVAAVHNLRGKLIEEFLVVALVCVLFLWHLRSSLVAVLTLPLGVLAAFIVMAWQGVSANIMSLGGIALAIGAMVDAAVVMIENAHKHLEHWRDAHGGDEPRGEARWRVIGAAAAEVGPALFFSLLVIALSFLPVFALQGQEGRLFKPLAYTKTYAMAAAAALAVTLIPVLMGYLVRGRIRAEQRNPLNRWLIRGYRPLLDAALKAPLALLLLAAAAVAATLWPASHIGSEFMPPLGEGTLLYMPTALPALSVGKAAELLQQTDRMLMTVPEVAHVFGKAGRADSATDPAPLSMFETTISFKPRSQWRPGMTMAKVEQALNRAVQVPGLANLFIPPIANRVDMQSTGIKSPIGIKVEGPDPVELQRLADAVVAAARGVPGVGSVATDHIASGRYVDVRIHPGAAQRYGLTQAELQQVIATAVGGDAIDQTVQGRERFPIVLRYPRRDRQSIEALRTLLVQARDGASVPLSAVADVHALAGPSMLSSEDGQLVSYVYVDSSSDLGGVVARLQRAVAAKVALPAGYTLGWSGQYAFLQRAEARLRTVIPAALAIIFVLIWSVFRRGAEAALIMLTLPFALVGGVWLVWLLGRPASVATMIGFIALAGVAAEFGVIMLLYLRQSWQRQLAAGHADAAALDAAIREGAVLRVRPKAMTVAVILAGLLPIMFGHGAGSEVMRAIAAPMVGGMITAPLLSMLVIPVGYRMLERHRLRAGRPLGEALPESAPADAAATDARP
jgi:Cu(I)/Ag(I) efflux system membrane protein CusA/SilA